MSETAPELIRAAKAERDASRLSEAIALQRRAVALLDGGDAGAHAHALRHLADMLSDAGEAAAAAPLFARVLDHYAGATTLDAANALRGAAVNAERLGEDARAFWEDLEARYAALGIAVGVAEARRRLSRPA